MLRAMVRRNPIRTAMICILQNYIIALGSAGLAVLLSLASVHSKAQGLAWQCGGFDEVQWDYRTASRRQRIEVEGAHFVPKVEALIAGNRGTLEGDLRYTLTASPNHHRALVSITRLADRMKNDNIRGLVYSIDCYYQRAVRFASNDVIVRMLYAQYLGSRGRTDDATAQLKYAIALADDNPITHQNIGLIYLELKFFEEALAQAHRALAMGFESPTLVSALKSAGRWREPDPSSAAPAASQSLSSAASAASAASATKQN